MFLGGLRLCPDVLRIGCQSIEVQIQLVVEIPLLVVLRFHSCCHFVGPLIRLVHLKRKNVIPLHFNKYIIRQESTFVPFCIINYRISEKQKTDDIKRNDNLNVFHYFLIISFFGGGHGFAVASGGGLTRKHCKSKQLVTTEKSAAIQSSTPQHILFLSGGFNFSFFHRIWFNNIPSDTIGKMEMFQRMILDHVLSIRYV